MRRVEADALVGASRDEVWELYDDIAGTPRWVPFVREILYVSGPARVGTVYRERTRIVGIPGSGAVGDHGAPAARSPGPRQRRRAHSTRRTVDHVRGARLRDVGPPGDRDPILAVGTGRAASTSCSRSSRRAGPCARRWRARSVRSRATPAAEVPERPPRAPRGGSGIENGPPGGTGSGLRRRPASRRRNDAPPHVVRMLAVRSMAKPYDRAAAGGYWPRVTSGMDEMAGTGGAIRTPIGPSPPHGRGLPDTSSGVTGQRRRPAELLDHGRRPRPRRPRPGRAPQAPPHDRPWRGRRPPRAGRRRAAPG